MPLSHQRCWHVWAGRPPVLLHGHRRLTKLQVRSGSGSRQVPLSHLSHMITLLQFSLAAWHAAHVSSSRFSYHVGRQTCSGTKGASTLLPVRLWAGSCGPCPRRRFFVPCSGLLLSHALRVGQIPIGHFRMVPVISRLANGLRGKPLSVPRKSSPSGTRLCRSVYPARGCPNFQRALCRGFFSSGPSPSHLLPGCQSSGLRSIFSLQRVYAGIVLYPCINGQSPDALQPQSLSAWCQLGRGQGWRSGFFPAV